MNKKNVIEGLEKQNMSTTKECKKDTSQKG